MKKEIAIITMHGVKNFGSYLQAFATYRWFLDKDYSPLIIDYKYPSDIHRKTAYYNKKKIKLVAEKLSLFNRIIRYICKNIIHQDSNLRSRRFDDFYKDNIRLTRKYESLDELKTDMPIADIYLSGSDQVWNPDFVGTDTAFLLSWVPEGKKKISYASSFANSELPRELWETYKYNLLRYSAISIREKSNILKQDLGIEGAIVLDPTLLINKEQWKFFCIGEPIEKGEYIACYLLGYNFNPFPFAYEVIEKVKKIINCEKIIIIDGHPEDILKGYNVHTNIGPQDFLNILYYSKYIITSSFHGTAFAVNFGKPFSSIVSDEFEDNRQESFLALMNLECRIIKKNSNFVINKEKLECESLLNSFRKLSESFLCKALAND